MTKCKCVWLNLSLPTALAELETDEVVPQLLSRQKAPLSVHTVHTLKHHGHWSIDVQREVHPAPQNIIVSLPAFGNNLYLNLTRDHSILASDFVVEERLKDQRVVVNHLSTNQLCFYSGFIINHTDSLASLSTCGGLVNLSKFFLTCW